VLYPSLVQGDGAAEQLINGVKYFNEAKNVDVIIIGRGGGSLEDLWAFNNETLARTIFASEIPVVSAVGHEIDYTICDFVADKRAPTPSAAAEIALPDSMQLRASLTSDVSLLGHLLNERVKREREKLTRLAGSYVMRIPESILADHRLSLDKASEKLDNALEKKLTNKKYSLKEHAARMTALNPLAVLSRGYSAVSDSESGEIVTGVRKLSPDMNVELRFSDGAAQAKIIKTEVYDGEKYKV